MEQELKQTLDKITLANKDLKQRMQSEHWCVSYSNKTDMLSIGAEFPKDTHYVALDDGIMLRVDKNYRVYGFSIENTKLFIKENPELGYMLSFIVYPIRSYFKLLSYFLVYQTLIGFYAMRNMRIMTSISDHVAGKAIFAS